MSTSVICIGRTGKCLNMRQLLTPLFFPWATKRHPDHKRQRPARLRARAMKQARKLKVMPVPLAKVDRTMYDIRWDPHAGQWFTRTFQYDGRRRAA